MKFFTTSRLSENIRETPEGYLVCVGVPIARTGEMVYMKGETPLESDIDGKVIITRDAREVFRDETMASFTGKPVTISHPEEFVAPENWKELTCGIVQNVRRGKGENENDLVADLLITDSVAIGRVKSGLREVSCGYEAIYTQAGVGRGTQSNIIGNHVALVEQGRAGSSYQIQDHKGKGLQMTALEKIKALFTKAQDEALKIAAEGETKDGGTVAPQAVSGDAVSEMKNYFDSKFAEMMGKKDAPTDAGGASTQPTSFTPAEIKAKDEENAKAEAEKKQSNRDAWIDAQMEKESKDAKEDEEESEDGDDEDDETDDAFVEGELTGDDASRLEILAPGIVAKSKDQKGTKLLGLLAAYRTHDGKAAIDLFTDGKKPDIRNCEVVFKAASEVLKVSRANDLSKTKDGSYRDKAEDLAGKVMTPEELNKKNEAYWADKAKNSK